MKFTPAIISAMTPVWPDGARDGASGFLDKPRASIDEKLAEMWAAITKMLDDASRTDEWKHQRFNSIAKEAGDWLAAEAPKVIKGAESVLAQLERKMAEKVPAISELRLFRNLDFILNQPSPGEVIEHTLRKADEIETLQAIAGTPPVMSSIVRDEWRTRAQHAIWATVDAESFAAWSTLDELLLAYAKTVDVAEQLITWVGTASEVDLDNYVSSREPTVEAQRAVRDYLSGETRNSQQPRQGGIPVDMVKSREDLVSVADKAAFIKAKGYAAFVALPDHASAA